MVVILHFGNFRITNRNLFGQQFVFLKQLVTETLFKKYT